MAARAARALTEIAQGEEWIDAHVAVGPRDTQSRGLLLDVARPAHRLRKRRFLGGRAGRGRRPARGGIQSQARARGGARVGVGPPPAPRLTAPQPRAPPPPRGP